VHGLLTKLICCKNENINTKEFHEQFNKRMKKFYNDPRSTINDDPENELIPAKVIIEKILRSHTDEDGEIIILENAYEWGKNGCKNEKDFIKIIIAPYIKAYNNRIFQYITKCQYGDHDYGRRLQQITTKETQELFKYYEYLTQQIQHQLTLTQK
jgi:hypothetical protein